MHYETGLERSLERSLVAATKAAGGLAIKLPAAWYAGIPDRMLLLPGGRVVFVELKRASGSKTSLKQKRWAEKLKRRGFEYHQIHDKAGIRALRFKGNHTY